MWGIIVESALSVAWAYAFLLSIGLWALGKVVPLPEGLNVPTIVPPAFWGMVLAVTNLLQVASAIAIERRYERGLIGALFWIIWYPLAFWIIAAAAVVVGFPRALLLCRPKRALWTSPDRGFRTFTYAATLIESLAGCCDGTRPGLGHIRLVASLCTRAPVEPAAQ